MTHYVVFRRTGGGTPALVDAIAASSRRVADQRFAAHHEHTFEVLLVTANWGEAAERIATERAAVGHVELPVSNWGHYDHSCDTCSRDGHHCSLCETIVGHGHTHHDVIEPLDADADLAAVLP